MAALWPERVRGLVSCGTPYNIQDVAKARTPVAPEEEHRYWYWYYLNSARGRAALAGDRVGLCRELWRLFSTAWRFDEATYARTAPAFDNPDFVAVVAHSYRSRIGEVAGDPALEPLERRLLARPPIAVPTVALQGAADGVDPPDSSADPAAHFTGPFTRRVLPGVGHNLPQEAPAAFADAVLALG